MATEKNCVEGLGSRLLGSYTNHYSVSSQHNCMYIPESPHILFLTITIGPFY